MAWGLVTANRGSVGNKTSGTSQAVAVNANVVIGNVLVVFVAMDNIQTTDGDSADVLSVTDDQGNTYTKAVTSTNGQGAANGGSTASIWFSKIATQLNNGQNVTITFNGTISAKGISLAEYSITSGNVVSVVGTPQRQALDAGTAISLTISDAPSGEHLWLGMSGVEGPTADSITPDADYTDVIRSGSNAGGAATNQTCNPESRILNATADTFNQTLGTARDAAGAFVTLDETIPPEVPVGEGPGMPENSISLLGVGI